MAIREMTYQEEEVRHQQQMAADYEQQEAEERDERIRSNFEMQKVHDLGASCKQFWQGKVGRYVLDRAARDADNAVKTLKALKRTNFKSSQEFIDAVEECQLQADTPARVWTWLTEAIREAEEADTLIEGENDA